MPSGGGKQEASPIIYFVYRLSSKLCPQYVSLQLPARESRSSRKQLLSTVARAHAAMAEGLHGSPACQVLKVVQNFRADHATEAPSLVTFDILP